MVLWQISTFHHLHTSGFGRPFPRHGLQLLFWFSNHCVTFDLDVLRMVSECEPENGAYGFHRFGNLEELLPVLPRSSRELVYFVVGNLRVRSYPGSADLPPFVRENLGVVGGASNSDRIIISYQPEARLVARVYVTEHDDANAGRFRSDGTHEVAPELIRLLQNPELDLSSLLALMGYYDDLVAFPEAEETRAALGAVQRPDPDRFRSVVPYSAPRRTRRRKTKRSRKQISWNLRWTDPYRDYYEDSWIRSRNYGAGYGASYGGGYGSGGGGGFSRFLKFLLKVGAIYLAAKCFRWLMRNFWSPNWEQNLLKKQTSRFPSSPATHIMLDYVY